jgi:hypothetical protein
LNHPKILSHRITRQRLRIILHDEISCQPHPRPHVQGDLHCIIPENYSRIEFSTP